MQNSLTGAGTVTTEEKTGTYTHFLCSVTSTAAWAISNMEQATLTIVHNRQGGTDSVASGNLFAISKSNNPSSFEGLDMDAGGNFLYGFVLPLAQPVRVRPGESLSATLTIPQAATGQVTSIELVQGIGVGQSVGTVAVFSLDKTRASVNYGLGDNVKQIAIVQTSTAHVVTGFNLTSDKANLTLNTGSFNALMAEQWPRIPEVFSYIVYRTPDGVDLDNVQVMVNCNSGATGNAYMVVYAGIDSPDLMNQALTLTAKHQNRDLEKVRRVLGNR